MVRHIISKLRIASTCWLGQGEMFFESSSTLKRWYMVSLVTCVKLSQNPQKKESKTVLFVLQCQTNLSLCQLATWDLMSNSLPVTTSHTCTLVELSTWVKWRGPRGMGQCLIRLPFVCTEFQVFPDFSVLDAQISLFTKWNQNGQKVLGIKEEVHCGRLLLCCNLIL